MWTKKWKVELNPSKTECIATTRSIQPNVTLNKDGVSIAEVGEHKHLGLMLQHNAKWGLQIHDLVKHAEKRLCVLASYGKRFNRLTLT